tara:strand:- start:370 stop:897 length:528 start_codon:yes stop_codon:yes gene_type:complete
VEDGTIILVGATIENPSFQINAALLSRTQVVILKPPTKPVLMALLQRAEAYVGHKVPLNSEARKAMCSMAYVDGGYLLNMVEGLFNLPKEPELDIEGLVTEVRQKQPLYDKAGGSHFNLISALHKSLRGSDLDAALYWFARIIDGGENPRYVARRLVRFASEDIVLADPNALTLS